MHIEIIKGNLFESNSEAIILTVDGARKGMEGNIARVFGRLYPDAWEELEYNIKYPIHLGSAKIYPIDADLECKFKYCVVASTLHHIEVLEKNEKLSIISSALKNSLTLATNIGALSICSGILIGGWRLELEEALEEMIKTYQWFKSSFLKASQLNIYILGNEEFSRVEAYLNLKYPYIKREVGGNFLL